MSLVLRVKCQQRQFTHVSKDKRAPGRSTWGPADDIRGLSLTSISAALTHFTRCNRCEVPDKSQLPGADPLSRLESGRQRGARQVGAALIGRKAWFQILASFLTSDLVLEKSADLFEINPLVVGKHTSYGFNLKCIGNCSTVQNVVPLDEGSTCALPWPGMFYGRQVGSAN